jgi:hypothetical protein
MELLAILLLLVPLLIGVPFALGSTRRTDPPQRAGIVAGESIITAAPESVEPVPIRPLRHACGCNTAGCTL